MHDIKRELLIADLRYLGIEAEVTSSPYIIVWFQSLEDMNLYKISGKVRENLDLTFALVLN